MATVRIPNELEAEQIAINHVVHGMSKSACYRKFNSNAVNTQPNTVWCSASALFKHTIVNQWISQVTHTHTLHVREQMKITMTGQIDKLEAVYTDAMATKQLGSAVSAVDKQNQLARLYDRDMDAPPVIHELDFGTVDKPMTKQ